MVTWQGLVIISNWGGKNLNKSPGSSSLSNPFVNRRKKFPKIMVITKKNKMFFLFVEFISLQGFTPVIFLIGRFSIENNR
jgi:hypothetical protein